MTWSATLDAYAETLDAMQRSLTEGLHSIVAPFIPPTDLGPLPAELADRATELFVQGAEVEAMMLEAREALDTALREPQAPQRPTPRPSMLDARV